jgi:hypothetical protein
MELFVDGATSTISARMLSPRTPRSGNKEKREEENDRMAQEEEGRDNEVEDVAEEE